MHGDKQAAVKTSRTDSGDKMAEALEAVTRMSEAAGCCCVQCFIANLMVFHFGVKAENPVSFEEFGHFLSKTLTTAGYVRNDFAKGVAKALGSDVAPDMITMIQLHMMKIDGEETPFSAETLH